MKQTKYIIIMLLSILVFPSVVKAEAYYTNKMGVEMDEYNYNRLMDKLSPIMVDTMKQDLYDELLTKEINLVAEDSVYMEYINAAGVPLEIINPLIVSGVPDGYSTASKRLTISMFELEENMYYAHASNEWVQLPVTRVYDVFAMRLDGFSIINHSHEGTQIYRNSEGIQTIFYMYNGANTMNFSNGFGMSMNLVNDINITALINVITARLQGSHGDVSVSYQHAIRSTVTKAQSMNYTLHVSGLGGVIDFNDYNIANKYDQMLGVYAQI